MLKSSHKVLFPVFFVFWAWVIWTVDVVAALPSPVLQVLPPDDCGWIRLRAAGETGAVYTIHASTNLSQWSAIATTHDEIAAYPDGAMPNLSHRYYRVSAAIKTATNDWKNEVHFPTDAFLSSPAGIVLGADFRWIKFAIPFNEPYRVYYQDSAKYEFHYDFAKERLEPFRGMTSVEFERVALHMNQQQVLLGTLLFPPYPNDAEFGIQFVGLDPYPAEFVARSFDLVRATVAGRSNVTAFYVPSYEQARVAETNRNYFESRGIQVASADRWITGDDIYSLGWALGRLKYFAGSEINAAFTDGRLLPQDILLTDGVPAEVPVLAGILTLTPSTPNSHVAILAKTFGVPFAYLSDPTLRQRVQGFVGKDIVLRLDPFFASVRVIELESTMDPGLREEILDLKAPPKLEIVPKAQYGAISASTENLTPADIKFFGGKAANYGFLRRKIPNRSQTAIAISFDLWDAFLDQALPGGSTLRSNIQSRLRAYTYPPNVSNLKRDLEAIRELIKDDADFSPAQKQAIMAALSGFDNTRNIRFRSSTNVEDSEQFTGAGLYDSYSGCLQDDLDGDNQGPSICDPTEENERGVFRAIKRVYASFYNDNAFIERLRHGIDESKVGMAMLVHHSVPDEFELANGVASIRAMRGGGASNDSTNGDLVTQKGAVSVTNPDGSARPEVVQGYHHPMGAGGFLRQRSSLVPLGAYVLNWDAEYVELMNLFARVADGFHQYFPQKRDFTLDFEYKKVAPGVLDVKQVREIPVNTSTNPLPTYLVHETNRYTVFQGEAADVFSNHRLKSFWRFHTKNVRLVQSNLTASLFLNVETDYLEGRQTNRLTGAPSTFPNASHAVEGDFVLDRWVIGSGADRRDFALQVEVRREIDPPQAPVFTLADLDVKLIVDYATPQPSLEWGLNGQEPTTVSKHSVVLEPPRPLTENSLLQERTATAGNLKVTTSFYWPALPGRGIGDKTAPLAGWKQTVIEGLTAQPITLRGEFSQTYRPGHHNFAEEFIFEPALEEGISPSVLAELEAANVKFIYMLVNFERNELKILGLDGVFRNGN
jgi:hypothetical protein